MGIGGGGAGGRGIRGLFRPQRDKGKENVGVKKLGWGNMCVYMSRLSSFPAGPPAETQPLWTHAHGDHARTGSWAITTQE